MENNGFDLENCVGVCSDGTAAMTRKHSGVIKRIEKFAPIFVSTLFFLFFFTEKV